MNIDDIRDFDAVLLRRSAEFIPRPRMRTSVRSGFIRRVSKWKNTAARFLLRTEVRSSKRGINSALRCIFAIPLFLFPMPTPAAVVKLIAPDAPPPNVVVGEYPDDREAAADLCDYLSRVTGQAIEPSSFPAPSGVIIHVGADSFVRAHISDLDSLRGDGFFVKLLDVADRRHLILAGRTASSSQWATERFLMNHCGVRWLFPDPKYGEVVPSKPVLTIPDSLSERHEPDYLSRANCGMYMYCRNRKYLRLGPIGGSFGSHEIQFMFSDEEFAEHPEWFAYFKGKRQWWKYGNGWQICTTNPGTVDHAVKYADEYFRRNPDAAAVSVGQNDGSGWCECETCTAFVNSFDPPYTYSERWFHWVNEVAREVAQRHPGKWVESMAYASTSTPTRFPLEDNVAITKTIVYDNELELAEQWKSVCKSVNLYSYMYGNSFMGFRHYPRAAQEFLQWGHDVLGAVAHVAECGGDWAFDGPKYHYIQALQWDVNADLDALMRDFCESSYGSAAEPMREFWDRLEKIYDRRLPTDYGRTRKRWLFYQWVTWSMNSYVQPNDEFAPYRLEDVAFLDDRIAGAIRRAEADSAAVQFRLARVSDAWRYFRTLVISALEHYPATPEPDIAAAEAADEAIRHAREIADLRAERRHYDRQMLRYPIINRRRAGRNFWSWSEGITLFSRENYLIDELCSGITAFLDGSQGTDSARTFWREIPTSDNLYEYARTQLYLLDHAAPTNLLVNGGFEAGTTAGWTIDASERVTRDGAHTGTSALLASSSTSAIRQRVSVRPLERYRLTAWAKYVGEPPPGAVPLETILEFYGGAKRVWPEPTRAVAVSENQESGWFRIRSTVTIPPGADTVEVQVRRRSGGRNLWDDISFERILGPPEITDGRLKETFAGTALGVDTWVETSDHRSEPPVIENGWATFRRDRTHPINSLARFDGLLAHDGDSRYRLRFHAATVDGLPEKDTQFAVGILNGPGPISISGTGMFWYFYFSSKERARPMVSAFCFQGGTRSGSATYNLDHLANPVTNVWYTLQFGPGEVAMYAAADRLDASPASHMGTFTHGITNLVADGPVFLKLDSADYRLDSISLSRPADAEDPPSLRPRNAPTRDEANQLVMPEPE